MTIVSFWRNQNFGYYPKNLDVTPFSKESTRLSSSFHKILYIFLFFVDREPSRIESVHVWILIYDFFEQKCKDFGFHRIRGNRGCVRRSETEEEVRAR